MSIMSNTSHLRYGLNRRPAEPREPAGLMSRRRMNAATAVKPKGWVKANSHAGIGQQAASQPPVHHSPDGFIPMQRHRTGGFKPQQPPVSPARQNAAQTPIHGNTQGTAPVQSVTRMAESKVSPGYQNVQAQTVDTGIGQVNAHTANTVQAGRVDPVHASTVNPGTGQVQFQNAQNAKMQDRNPVQTERIAPGTGQVQFNTQQLSAQSTVEGRMNSLMSRDNPYMQQARTRAAQRANARGLLNSSMAVTAGESAALDAALPIAQQDARTHFANDQQNLAYQNEQAKLNGANETDVAKFNANSGNEMGRYNADSLMKRDQYNAGFEQEANLTNAAAQNEAAKLNAGTAVDVAKYNADANNNMGQFNANTQVKQNEFDSAQAQQNNQFNANVQNDAARLNAGTAVDLNKFNATTVNDNNRRNSDANLQNDQYNAQLLQQNEQFNASSLNDARSKFAAEKNKQNFEVLATDLKRQMANVDQANAKELTGLEQQFKLRENMDKVMGKAYQQLIAGMSDIYANEKDGQVASDKVRALLNSAGATFQFSNGLNVKPDTLKAPDKPASTSGGNAPSDGRNYFIPNTAILGGGD